MLKSFGAYALFCFVGILGVGWASECPLGPEPVQGIRARFYSELTRLEVPPHLHDIFWGHFRERALERAAIPDGEIQRFRLFRYRPTRWVVRQELAVPEAMEERIALLSHWPSRVAGEESRTDGDRIKIALGILLSDLEAFLAPEFSIPLTGDQRRYLQGVMVAAQGLLERDLSTPEALEDGAKEYVRLNTQGSVPRRLVRRMKFIFWEMPWVARMYGAQKVLRRQVNAERDAETRRRAAERAEAERLRHEQAAQAALEAEAARLAQRAAAAEQLARRQAQEAEGRRVREREKWDKEKQDLERTYREHRDRLGLLLGSEIRDRLNDLAPWFSVDEGKLTEVSVSEIGVVLALLARHSTHCGAEGPAAKHAEILSGDIKRLVTRLAAKKLFYRASIRRA